MAKKEKVVWLKSHPSYSYFAGNICEIEADKFVELSKTKHIRLYDPGKDDPKMEDKSDLPEDFPARDILIREGLPLLDDVKKIYDSLTEIPGIGKATAKQITDYLGD